MRLATGRAGNRIYEDEQILDLFTNACLTQGSAHSEGEAGWFLDENDVCDDVLAEGGTLVSLKGQPSKKLAEEYGVQGRSIFAQPDAATLTKINALLEDATLDVTISSVRPLAEARAAHEQVEAGHTRGKHVLQIVK